MLKDDVKQHGGSASQIVESYGTLYDVTVCKVPWGFLVIKKPLDRVEAMLMSLKPVE